MARDRCDYRIIHDERVAAAREAALAEEEVCEMAMLFKAMADVNRLKVLQALEQAEMCVCDLAAYLQVSESAISHQLRFLRQLKLVANRRQGAVLYYRLRDGHVGGLLQLALDHVRE